MRLDERGLRLRSTRVKQAAELGIALSSQGCAASPAQVTPTAPHALAEQHRVEYSRSGITEWYANGVLGLEHGFTVHRDLGCADGKLAFDLTLSGDIDVSIR